MLVVCERLHRQKNNPLIKRNPLCVYEFMRQWIVILFLYSPALYAQEQRFEIRMGGLNLGQLHSSREAGRIRLESRVRVPLALFTLRVGYVVDSRFGANHQLIRSRVDAETNKGTFFTTTEPTGKGYAMKSEQYGETVEQTISKPIYWTVSRLFFEEPVGVREVYAEYYGTLMPLEVRGPGQYVVRWGKNRDVYVYQKGQLQKIIKENPWKNFEIRRPTEKDLGP